MATTQTTNDIPEDGRQSSKLDEILNTDEGIMHCCGQVTPEEAKSEIVQLFKDIVNRRTGLLVSGEQMEAFDMLREELNKEIDKL